MSNLMRDTGYGCEIPDARCQIPDVGCEIRDTGQIMDDLIPVCRQDGGVLIGDVGFWILDF
jgi:hypothetical protein